MFAKGPEAWEALIRTQETLQLDLETPDAVFQQQMPTNIREIQALIRALSAPGITLRGFQVELAVPHHAFALKAGVVAELTLDFVVRAVAYLMLQRLLPARRAEVAEHALVLGVRVDVVVGAVPATTTLSVHRQAKEHLTHREDY